MTVREEADQFSHNQHTLERSGGQAAFPADRIRALGMDQSSGLPVSTFARAYCEAVEETHNGEILDVRKWQ